MGKGPGAMRTVSLEQARAAKAEAVRRFEKTEAVTGVGLTRVAGSYVVKVNVSQATTGLPRAIDGVPLKVEIVGRVVRRRR